MDMERYSISCNVCGFVDTRETKTAALAFAKTLRSAFHNKCGEGITVFDRMAHHGAAEMWTSDGSSLGVSP